MYIFIHINICIHIHTYKYVYRYGNFISYIFEYTYTHAVGPQICKKYTHIGKNLKRKKPKY